MISNYNKRNRTIEYDGNNVISNYTKKITINECHKITILPNSINQIHIKDDININNYRGYLPNSIINIINDDDNDNSNYNHNYNRNYDKNKICCVINIYKIKYTNVYTNTMHNKNIFLFENIIQIKCGLTNKIQKKIFSSLKSVNLYINSDEKYGELLKNINSLHINYNYNHIALNKQIYFLKNVYELCMTNWSIYIDIIDLSHFKCVHTIKCNDYISQQDVFILKTMSYNYVLLVNIQSIKKKYLNNISCVYVLSIMRINMENNLIYSLKYIHTLSMKHCSDIGDILYLKNVNTLTIDRCSKIKNIIVLKNIKTLKIDLLLNKLSGNKYLNNKTFAIISCNENNANNFQLTMFVKKIIIPSYIDKSIQHRLSQIKTHNSQILKI